MKSINPYNGALIREYREHDEKEILEAIDASWQAFLKFREMDIRDKSSLMHNVAGVLKNEVDKYAEIITLEMGKTIRESRAEVEKCAWVSSYYADHAERFLSPEVAESDASQSYVRFDPIGPVLAVMPWNFPFWQVYRFAAPALMAGNTAVLKLASNVPGCSLAIENIFREAGFPKHVFQSILVPSSRVETIIRHKRIKAVTLTGSEPAGRSVASVAGDEIKKSVLELGGSDPFIVLEDADLEKCSRTAVQARMINAGQSCIAAKRFIVVQSVLEEFEKRQFDLISKLKTGNPMDENVDVGPLARPDLVEELDRLVQQSVQAGARLLFGGKPGNGKGSFYSPTLLTDVKKGMPVYEEETFGPVTAIIPAEDEYEAISIANDSNFGLSSSLWTNNIEKGKTLARQLETGAVFINGMSKSDPRLPFGGIKRSGYGRELSAYGIKEFVNIKSVWIS